MGYTPITTQLLIHWLDNINLFLTIRFIKKKGFNDVSTHNVLCLGQKVKIFSNVSRASSSTCLWCSLHVGNYKSCLRLATLPWRLNFCSGQLMSLLPASDWCSPFLCLEDGFNGAAQDVQSLKSCFMTSCCFNLLPELSAAFLHLHYAFCSPIFSEAYSLTNQIYTLITLDTIY